MKKTLTFILFFGALNCFSQNQQPVNPNASREANALLKYLSRIDNRKILSGQHSYNDNPEQYYNLAYEITGEYPAVWGTDFIWRGNADPGEKVVQAAIQKHNEGAIITLMWHAGRPTDEPPYAWRESIQGELSEEEWTALTTLGTDLHARWLAQVDKVAEHLKQLQNANVPVLWRPYHEMNGVWFWWGDKKGRNGYVKLWKMMFDRYVNHHQLHNLIWVWNANAPRDLPGDEAFAYEHYFPGSEYVDVLATDVYNFDYEQNEYEALLKLADGKVIALGEVGKLPNKKILESQPSWAWFMVWSNWLETANSPENVKTVYKHPNTMNRDEVRIRWQSGAAELKPLSKLRVQGNSFMDEEGNTLVFHGYNTSDPDKLADQRYWNKTYFEEMKRWGANVVRFPVHPRAWRKRGVANYLNLLDQGIGWATELGLYVIIDWHSIGNLRTQLYQSPGYKTTQTETFEFWRTIARRYGDNPTVAFYELFNEPTLYNGQLGSCTWRQWKELVEEMIGVIRANGGEGIPLVAGFNWAYDLTPVKKNPIKAEGIAYVSHPYPQKRSKPWEKKWTEDWGFIKEKYPLILTEIGFAGEEERGAHIPVISDESYGEAITKYCDEKDISYVVWVFDPQWAPRLFKDWDYTPTRHGAYFKAHMSKYPK